MDARLQADAEAFPELLRMAYEAAVAALHTLPERPVGRRTMPATPTALPSEGIGGTAALDLFHQRYASGMTGSAGPRYWGFVTGGATPAAVAGDWLVSAYDQNAVGSDDGAAPQIERDAVNMLRQLLGLPDAYSGAFVTGATMANFVGLATGRQWAGQQQGLDIAEDGLQALSPIAVLSGTPHSCIAKALAMLGMGRRSIGLVPCMPEREAIDVAALRDALQELKGTPCIVVANAGTVNSVDFDDLRAIAALRHEFPFWLHIDAAFGGYAACSPATRHLVEGMELGDSIAIDCHKWLNVPYDSAVVLTRHPALQLAVFRNSAAYLETGAAEPEFLHLTPENSRRLRALPAWLSMLAYGATGYREIVERNCTLARLLGERIASSGTFRLLAPVRLNVVCFTLAPQDGVASAETIRHYLAALQATGKVVLTPTVYGGVPAIRAAFANWRSEVADLDIAWQAMCDVASTSLVEHSETRDV